MDKTININEQFFDGAYKEVWRHLIPEGLTEAECDFIVQAAGLGTGDAVLDLMCGYGRHALELVRRDMRVTAIDNAPEYISEINDRSKTEGLSVKAVLGTVLEAPWEGPYKAVLCMGNSFAFFDREEASRLLRKIAAHLLPGGSFIINTWMVAEIALHHFKPAEWYYAGPFKCILEYRYCFQPSRIESEQTILGEDGSMEVRRGIDYIFSLNELESMLNDAGLSLAGLYSTPRNRAFKLGDSRLYLVARKEA